MATSGVVARLRERTTTVSVALVVLVHLGLILITPNGVDIQLLVGVEIAVLLLVLGVEWFGGVPASEMLPLAGGFVALLATTWGFQRVSTSLTGASVLVVTTLAVLVYSLHRYELLVLGVVDQ